MEMLNKENYAFEQKTTVDSTLNMFREGVEGGVVGGIIPKV